MYLRRHGAPQQRSEGTASRVAHSGPAARTHPAVLPRPPLCPAAPNLSTSTAFWHMHITRHPESFSTLEPTLVTRTIVATYLRLLAEYHVVR